MREGHERAAVNILVSDLIMGAWDGKILRMNSMGARCDRGGALGPELES